MIMKSMIEKVSRPGRAHGLLGGRLSARINRSLSVKTGFRSLSFVVPTFVAGATAILLSIGSVGCVVAATGTDPGNDKSQTQELDNDTTTAGGNVAKVPDYETVKAGGQGGGPDPSPWRQSVEAQTGGPDGPDPSPWDVNTNAPTTNATRK